MTKHNETKEGSTTVNLGGRPPALKPPHVQILLEIVARSPQASLDVIANELFRRSGLRVCTATIRRCLRA